MIPPSVKKLIGWNALVLFGIDYWIIKYAVPTNPLQLVETAYLLIVSN